ncbi:MAG: hypothetical protein K2L36_08320 [Eubacterium sp.]|nr:hypothetical protein [Eubacterium sp.]
MPNIQAYYINRNHYDFIDKNGNRVVGSNINCLLGDDIVKASVTDEQYKALANTKFGDIVGLDVRVKGKFAKHILAK